MIRGLIGVDGATLRVEVVVSRSDRQALLSSHHPIPQPITLTALLDTGADVPCIDTAALSRIALRRLRAFTRIDAPGASGLPYQPAYSASLTLLHPSGRPVDDLII